MSLVTTKYQTHKNTSTISATLFFLLLGILTAFFFHIDFLYPVIFSLILTIISFFYCFNRFKQKRISVLSLYVLGICFLPFIHLIPYAFNNIMNNPFILGSGEGAIILYNRKIIELTAMIGATSALGIAFCISIFDMKQKYKLYSTLNAQGDFIKTLPLLFWFFWFFIGLILFVGTTPVGGSIFNTQYHMQKTGFLDIIPSAYLISYFILIFVIVDAFLDRTSLFRGKVKKFFCLFIFFFILIGLSTGTRETLPLILGVILFYYYWANLYLKNSSIQKFPFKKLLLFVLIMLFFGSIMGYARSEAVDKNFVELLELIKIRLSLNLFLLGTWSSSLATTLSVAHDYVDIQEFKFGKDYYNLFVSIPPGFVADFFGYTRPISMYSGPAYEMRYGQGGTHITVLPFRNFGIIGVFIISAIWFSIILHLEKICNRRFSVITLSILVTIVTTAPMFLWYGEKTAITGAIIFIFLSFAYKVCLGLSRIKVR